MPYKVLNMCDTCNFIFAKCKSTPIFAVELTEPSNNLDLEFETHGMLDSVIACDMYEEEK